MKGTRWLKTEVRSEAGPRAARSASLALAVLLGCLSAMPAGAQSVVCDTSREIACVTTLEVPTNTAATTVADRSSNQTLGGTWTMTQVHSGGNILGLALGLGRNDGQPRLYGGDFLASTVKEFTYDGAWANTSNIALPFQVREGLELGAGRGDDVVRVYAGEINGDGRVAEFTWDGDAWARADMGSTRQQLLTLAIGPGRDDGVDRLYFSTGSSPPSHIAREFSYTGVFWAEAPIPAPPSAVTGHTGIAVGDGRNDGRMRVYASTLALPIFSWNLYELSWNGAAWEAVLVATVPVETMGVAVGDGRNDGTNRIYVAGRTFGIYEYSFVDGAWSLTDSIPVGAELYDIAIGDGQNDGVNRLYVAKIQPGTVYEASFGENGWTVSTVGSAPSLYLWRVRVGDARGDGLNRVYASGSGGAVEFSWQ